MVPFRARVWTPWLTLALLAPLLLAPTVSAGHEYEHPVWFTWDTTQLDVLVLGVGDPAVGRVLHDAIEAWRVGIPQFAPAWLAGSLEIRAYIAGIDVAPPPGYEPDDVEIVLVPEGFMAVTTCGIAFTCPQGKLCYATATTHVLGGYDVVAHEFGHCLGLGHVFEHGVEYEPDFDIMGSGNVPGGKACPSNLNVQVLELVYGGLFGLPSGGTVFMSSVDYEQARC